MNRNFRTTAYAAVLGALLITSTAMAQTAGTCKLSVTINDMTTTTGGVAYDGGTDHYAVAWVTKGDGTFIKTLWRQGTSTLNSTKWTHHCATWTAARGGATGSTALDGYTSATANAGYSPTTPSPPVGPTPLASNPINVTWNCMDATNSAVVPDGTYIFRVQYAEDADEVDGPVTPAASLTWVKGPTAINTGTLANQGNLGMATNKFNFTAMSIIWTPTVVDTTPPTVAVTPTGTSTKTSPITFTLTFSEVVTGLTISGITVTNGTKGALSGSGTTYTLPVTPTGQGAVTCQVNAGAAADAAANPSTISNVASVTYDTVAPTVAVTPTGTATKTSPIAFTLTFSEVVTGLAASAITVTNGTKGALSGSGTTYTLPVTPTGQGAVTCLVNAAAAVDAATNSSTLSNTASVTYDTVAPTVAVTPTGTSTTTSPITFTLTFSKSVTGLAASAITVTNGTKGALSGSGTTYTLPVTPAAQGAVTCLVNAAAATDTATNPNTVSNTASVTFDTAYSSWANVLPVGQRGADQTPQNDGVTNLMKFACNLNPLAPDVSQLTAGGSETKGLPVQSVVGGKLRMEFLRRKASTNPGITYMLQFSSDLGATPWSGVDVTTTPAGVSIGDGTTWERVVVDDTVSDSKRFGRLKVVPTP